MFSEECARSCKWGANKTSMLRSTDRFVDKPSSGPDA